MNDRLFAYGTLRRDIRHSRFSLLLEAATRAVAPARMRGRLFDLGWYPGFVPAYQSGSWVYGEIHTLNDPEETLARVDEYEGCSPDNPRPHEFERVEMDAELEDGTHVPAWVYVYKGEVEGKPEVKSGDYKPAR